MSVTHIYGTHVRSSLCKYMPRHRRCQVIWLQRCIWFLWTLFDYDDFKHTLVQVVSLKISEKSRQITLHFECFAWLITPVDKMPLLIPRFTGPTWGPSGANRTQLGPMLAPWTLRSGSPCTLLCRGQLKAKCSHGIYVGWSLISSSTCQDHTLYQLTPFIPSPLIFD